MAVRHDLGSLRQSDQLTYFSGATALEKPLERDVDRSRDVAMARVAVSTCDAVELGSRPHVQEREVVVAEASTELVQPYVCH